MSETFGWKTGKPRRLLVERLEVRRVLDCHGIGSVGLCVPGDSNQDGEFNETDLITVFQAAKYQTDKPANWTEGDWNHDGKFDTADLVVAFQAGTYRRGQLGENLSRLVAGIPAHPWGIGPPIEITTSDQLYLAIPNRSAAEAVAERVDFDQQKLLLFSWSGSGQDRVIAEPTVVQDRTVIGLRFSFGATLDLRPHVGLLSVPKNASINFTQVSGLGLDDRVIHEDSARYEFTPSSRLVVSGGLAGVRDEYTMEGTLRLTRHADGSASIDEVFVTLHGSGLSGLDGKSLDEVLGLSGLTGVQFTSHSTVFSGIHGSAIVRLFVNVGELSLGIDGADFPSCCDMFQHTIRGKARRIDPA